MTAVLYIGNRNYSSWSLRGWLLARLSGLNFDARLIPLSTAASKSEVHAVSPSGFLPCLRCGDAVIWDSLAIAEYLHEQFPTARIWPVDPVRRAHARSLCAEMHSGFAELRRAMPMDIRARKPGRSYSDAVAADVRRIERIWSDCRGRSGAEGAFLFGDWCGADCMFAPVATRFVTYGTRLNLAAQRYVEAVCAHKDVAEWIAAARVEPWLIDYDQAAAAGTAPVAEYRP
ncbi:MAG: glutathione S-transferase family protein [Gammaproteobacteria bacterium]|nr:glutathione S-transferase family protein [Gammaproteobacteria bacterium]